MVMINQVIETVKVKSGDDYIVINASELTSEMVLFDAEPTMSDGFFIVADVDGEKHYWDGEAFQPEPTDKIYASDDSALSAISRTKAIKEYVEADLIQNVRAEAV